MAEETLAKKRRKAEFSTTGFTIFDFSHIIVGLAIMIMAFIYKDENYLLDVASTSAQIIPSILLIFFIIVILKHNTQSEEDERYFSFCWLVASIGMLLPEIFRIPGLTEDEISVAEAMTIVKIAISGLAFIFAAIALLSKDKDRWVRTQLIDAILFLLFVPVAIVGDAYEFAERNVAWLVVSTIEAIAPLWPALFALKTFHKMHKLGVKTATVKKA
jgi:hypothetical protein